MEPVPLIVTSVDVFDDKLLYPPYTSVAPTLFAFADATGFEKSTRTLNVVPATYVPLPVRNTILVTCKFACALIPTFTTWVPAFPLTVALVSFRTPDHVALMTTGF